MTPTILAIEDNEDDFKLLKSAFAKSSSDEGLLWVKDGQQAAEFLFNATYGLPDLIISDIKMPRIDGLESLRMVKNNRHTARIPFVIFTSSSLETDQKSALECGASLYVVKPRTFEELVRVTKNFDAIARGASGDDSRRARRIAFFHSLASCATFLETESSKWLSWFEMGFPFSIG